MEAGMKMVEPGPETPPDHDRLRNGSAPIEAIRARRRKLSERKSIDLLVPGYQGYLAVRYRPIQDDDLDKFIARMQSSDGTNTDAAIDLLLKAQECVLIREGEDLVPLRNGDAEDGPPIGLDLRLAEVLQYEAETARQVVRGLFSPDGTAPVAPNAHGGALIEWMQGNEGAIDQALLGE